MVLWNYLVVRPPYEFHDDAQMIHIPRSHAGIRNRCLTISRPPRQIERMLKLIASKRPNLAFFRKLLVMLLRKRQVNARSSETNVEPDQPVRIVCSSDVSVICMSGVAWITVARETQDIVLKTGERYIAARKARLFINGMPRCLLRFESVLQS